MGIVDRNKGITGLKPNFWINFPIPAKLRAELGYPSRTARESAGTSMRAAQALLALRKREVKDGTWRPPKEGGARGLTFAAYMADWIDKREATGVRGVRDERQRLHDYVLPAIGNKLLSEVRREDVKKLVAALHGRVSEKTGKPLAPRTIRHVYGTLRTLYADAVADEKVLVSPCTLKEKRDELPKKKDADPRWRGQALFTRQEAELLISDKRIPQPRRMRYAMIFLGGMRIGEAVARRWRDYEPDVKPLGRLAVATQHDDVALKTDDPRAVPIHPTLAKYLADWRAEGFELHYGRKPRPDDHIVPNQPKSKHRAGKPMDGKRVWANLQEDLDTLGLRRRRVHDTRRTFVTLALADGADKYLLKWVTHGRPKGDAFDDYASPPWAALCKQVECLNITYRSPK